MTGRHTVTTLALILVIGSAWPSSAQTPIRGLTAASEVRATYDAILDARFDEVPALLKHTCPPAPRQVCDLLDVVSLWWRIQINPDDTSRDAAFLAAADAAIASMEAWTRAEPQRAEAWFYLGGAYGARGQHRVLRRQPLSAARDGKRIKASLEQALALDPDMDDAYFGIGLYHYYADVAPAAAKILRFLLLLPGGDRTEGLREMLRARDGARILRGEADYQLHVIYLWYEHDPAKAIELLSGLEERFGHNPHFPQTIAEIQDAYLHDDTASLRSWQALLRKAENGDVRETSMAEARARLGVATELDRLFETDAALEQLRALITSAPRAPFGVMARAQLQRAQALDRLGQRSAAVDAYRAAIAAAGPSDPSDVAGRARTGLRRTPDQTTATAYRLSLEGWRALERGRLADADRLLTESLALRPRDPVTRVRRAHLLIARHEDDEGMWMLDTITGERDSTPPTIYAQACLDAARLHERRGDRARALELYVTASDVFGADQRTMESARRDAARLDATSPP